MLKGLNILYYVLGLQIIMQSRKGWSEIEDDRLLKIIKKYGDKNWTLISQKLSLGSTQDRTGKQCRQRWHNNLNPNINNKEWTSEEDQILFQAHDKFGSKWRQISKLFPGRTDNSIKNHFYSTVRSCLRRISNLNGQKQSAAFMKSIKPFVLSKIVQNTELTNLILNIGRNKSKSASNLVNMDERTISHINQQLKRISGQYQQLKSKGRSQEQSQHSSNSIAPLPSHQKLQQEGNQQQKSIRPESSSSLMYFEELEEDQLEEDDPVEQTHQEEKRTNHSRLAYFKSFEEQGHEPSQKQHPEQARQVQIWVEHDFFDQPEYRKDKLSYPKLQSKVSKNSQFQGHFEDQEKNRRNIENRKEQEQVGVQFDLQELINSD